MSDDPFVKDEKASDKKESGKGGKKEKQATVYFLWRKANQYKVVLKQRQEKMTEKGALPVAGSGMEVKADHGVLKTDDPEVIALMRKHPNYNGQRMDVSFREATDEELSFIKIIEQKKSPSSELLRRLRAMKAATNPDKRA